jgi:hypothetical protein
MAKLRATPWYPVNLSVGGVPVNLVKNRTPEGKFQIAKVLSPGGPGEGEFEVLWEGDSEAEAEAFALTQIEKESPGLLSQSRSVHS